MFQDIEQAYNAKLKKYSDEDIESLSITERHQLFNTLYTEAAKEVCLQNYLTKGCAKK